MLSIDRASRAALPLFISQRNLARVGRTLLSSQLLASLLFSDWPSKTFVLGLNQTWLLRIVNKEWPFKLPLGGLPWRHSLSRLSCPDISGSACRITPARVQERISTIAWKPRREGDRWVSLLFICFYILACFLRVLWSFLNFVIYFLALLISITMYAILSWHRFDC